MIASAHSIISVPLNAKENMICPRLENKVTIDGKWTSIDEWSDAFGGELIFLWGSGEAYFRIKHDDDSLYLVLDYVSLREPQERDTAGLLVDTKNDGGEIMQKDDYFLTHVYMTNETTVMVRGWGTGSKILDDFSDLNWKLIMNVDWELNPKGFSAASTIDARNNPYSTEGHVIWEFKIPKSEFSHETIRFVVYAINLKEENGACYPLIDMDKLDKPDLWTRLEFSDKTLIELAAQPEITKASTSTFTQTSTSSRTITSTHSPITSKATTETMIEPTSRTTVPWTAFLIALSTIVILVFILYQSRRRRTLQVRELSKYQYCINCGAPLKAGDLYCNSCGEHLE